MKVFINAAIPEIATDLLKKENFEIILSKNENDTNEWLANCKKADVLLNVGKRRFDKQFFDECPNIKAIALYSVGFDNVDIGEANARKIPIGNTPDVLSNATSDVAFLLMQMVSRKAGYNLEKVKSGNWKDFDVLEELGQELYNKKLGIYGLGRIGFEMAKKCTKAFDMEIIYHNRSQNAEAEKQLGAKYVSFEDLVKNSDVLSIHASYTQEQSQIFNKKSFGKMKPNSIFINTARGGFHKQNDLYEALVSKQIWGAGLDVTNPEPMEKDNMLLTLSNVCVFPHIGSSTFEARTGMARLAAKNIIAFAKGEKMPNCANPEVYADPKA